MAPSAVSPAQQDVDLTAAALQRKETAAAATNGNGHVNGLANGHANGHANGNGLKHADVVEAPLDASLLTYTLTKKPRAVPDEATANAGDETIASDHMVTASWRAGAGWDVPELKPYGPLSLMPTASVLHYATECFEGLKVFRGYDGRLRVFRPDRNAARMRMSAARISLPLIGTQPQLGVQASRQALLYIIMTFMPRMDSPLGGMRLHTSPRDMVRAWVGGFGYAKLILDGVTRRSCLDVARERLADDLVVTERKYSIAELMRADAEGRILEAFAAGTAYFICPVSQIHHRGRDIHIPLGPDNMPGPVTTKLKGWIGDIMYGREDHPWGVVIPEKE
ncbi:hypothetical protein HIM_05349 [Hirsutella minnesotensis 3608]|uniref:Branched-chain-amino-acid aminotransferase n=1 Tax=Hirsutella minnesotensis 3608 TaxID=1043627 RepID=A0A0F7ZPA4_9HYPO|nr:hypothetical protein HIM_05349 [Hirsutella minnesotensis 3608]